MTVQVTTPSRDANVLLALTVVLIVTTWSFFGRFSVVAAAAGIATGVWLQWWYRRHPAFLARSGPDRRPHMLTIAAIHVGGSRRRLRRSGHCVAQNAFGIFRERSDGAAALNAAPLRTTHLSHLLLSARP